MKRSICVLGALALIPMACGKGPEDPTHPDLPPPPRTDMGSPPPPTDMRPPPPPVPDLTVASVNFGVYTRSFQAALCLNQTPTGTKTNDGRQVTIRNVGRGSAGPYGAAFGLINPSTRKAYPCEGRLVDRDGLGPGETARWTGPLCCVLTVPGGQSYLTFVFADDEDDIEEGNEENNAVVSSQGFMVPTSQLGGPTEAEAWTGAGTLDPTEASVDMGGTRFSRAGTQTGGN